MKKLILIVFLFFNIVHLSNAQGFDWQYSPRLPFNTPTLFLGVNYNLNYLIHNGYIDLRVGNAYCCTFNSGIGVGSGYGFQIENWQTGDIAIFGLINYITFPGKFKAFDRPLKLPNGDEVIYEHEFTSSLSYLMLDFGAKWRLLGTHIFVGGELKSGLLVGKSSKQIERIISPDYFTFNDGSQLKEISDGIITDVNTFVISPGVRIGYDLNLGKGYYVSPTFNVGFPMINIAKANSAEWLTWNFSFGITLFRGF